MTFRVKGSLGDRAEADLAIRFYNELPRIDVEWRFQFDECSIGSFYDDESKLRVLFPLAFLPRITHDIPFGFVESRADRPFFPTTWVDLSEERGGLAYFHTGTCKHWVHENTLANLLAWGEHTDAIGNRLDTIYWGKNFDQRLRGSHAIRYALYPHGRSAGFGGIARAALAWNTRFPAYRSDSGAGRLPEELSLLSIQNKGFTATSVFAEGEGVACRLFSTSRREQKLEYSSSRISLTRLESIKGDPLRTVSPFQIARAGFHAGRGRARSRSTGE